MSNGTPRNGDSQSTNGNQYSYNEMSNKIIRGSRRYNDDNVNSNPTSIAGHISIKDMGSANVMVSTTSNTDTVDHVETSNSNESDDYKVVTENNSHFFNMILSTIRPFIEDASHEIIISAAESVLEILKEEDSNVTTKKASISDLLGETIDDISMKDLINFAGKIIDNEDEGQNIEDNGETNDVIAVELDDNDDAEELLAGEVQSEEEEEENVEEDGDDLKSKDIILSGKIDNVKLPQIYEITVSYIQKEISKALPDLKKDDIEKLWDQSFEILQQEDIDIKQLETSLLEIFNLENNSFINLCIQDRWKIVYGIKLQQNNNRSEIIEEMKQLKLDYLIKELDDNRGTKRKISDIEAETTRIPKLIDIEASTFVQTAPLMTTTKIKLPQGSFQQSKKLYDIITVPAPSPPPESNGDNELIPISTLPGWARAVFPSSEATNLNRVQSQVFPRVFNTDNNILLCAPTGAGKTNVAMLSILRAISNHRNPDTGKLNLKDFKLVYIAPLKALVQEQMREFSRRLTPAFGIVVNELTGDSSLSKKQLEETQVIVTTPEKWDVVTRKASQNAIVKKTKLIIIDEIHLLHDDRGPVLESIVSRTIRNVDANTRLIGLSATLPNYQDVAQFLHVDKSNDLFYFDASYRPCPLEQKFIGIKERKAIKRLSAMNEACKEKIEECLKNNHQAIIFVHSRKETFKTAKWLQEQLGGINKNEGSIEILQQEANEFKDKQLKEIIPGGFGIHHAGLLKNERSVVEDLFAQSHLKVLVSTATLAWGVNLPAHTVIIKGTETYSPEKGSWVQLSPQDILQMLGRAGRPRYDKSGEGVIITTQDEIQYYLAVLNQQLPIESQLMTRLADSVNAEIVLGTIENREDVVQWLGYTYLYIRMLRSPALYHVGVDIEDDKSLYWKRHDLAHSALTILQQNKLVQYDAESGNLVGTELGRIASHFYINYRTINMYNTQLKPWLSEIELIKIFSKSGEFEYVATRQEERLEIAKLMEKSPIPVKEKPNETSAKINLLLQAYISRLTLEGYALMSDMVYITQSAGRLLRAMHEISLQKNWSSLAKITLNLCKMVEKRMWLTNSPFRQFGDLAPKEIIRATESSHFPWMHYFNLSSAELAEALNLKSNAGRAYELLKQFPKLDLSYYIQTITSSLIRVQVQIVADWIWPQQKNVESFLVVVEDCNGDKVLFSDRFVVSKRDVENTYLLEFTLPILSPEQPVYFLNFISESWLHSEWKTPLNLSDLQLPKPFAAPRRLLDPPNIVSKSTFNDSEIEDLFDFKFFNKFQSELFPHLYNSIENIFIGIAKGGGKTVCAELALINHWKMGNTSRAVYLDPNQKKLDQLYKVWSKKFSTLEEKEVGIFNGTLVNDLSVIGSCNVILATPEQFNFVSKRWKQRRAVQDIGLLICDDVHEVGNGLKGAVYESVIARMRFVSAQLEKELRIVALSTPMANSRDFGEWIGCSKSNIFNFSPQERFYQIKEIRIQELPDESLTFPILKSISKEKSLVFCSSRSACLEVASEVINQGTLSEPTEDLESYLGRIHDEVLKNLISHGIGIFYPDMHYVDEVIVRRLFEHDVISILFATKDTSHFAPASSSVVILGTQEYDGKDHRFIDYSVNHILEMVGCCKDNLRDNGKVSIFTNNKSKIDFYSKFLNECLPVESYLNVSLHEFFVDEIASGTITNKQECIDWFTFTYFYRRLQLNPSFYDVNDTTHLGISEHLSELVETTLSNLEKIEMIEDDEESGDISPLNGSMIASHYGIRLNSMKLLKQLDNRAKLKLILETLTLSEEFDVINVRQNEEGLLKKIYSRVPYKATEENFSSPYFKAFILLQAHFSRIPLSLELESDKKKVLQIVLNLVYGCIDTLSSEGYLNALSAMTISQMVIQSVWNRDSPLKQIPQFNDAILARCKEHEVETVYDIMSLEDEERDEIFQLNESQLNQVAEFVNKYPNIDISYELDVAETIVANEPKDIIIKLERDEEMDDLTVVAHNYPSEVREGWWIVIGDIQTKQLYSIKKTTIKNESQEIKLSFTIPNPGHHNLSIWCMCDSYVDADKEISFEIDVV
ncbi:RNA helicase-related protein required for pre-mRNA splicing [Scheffersomyces coipomensis]|uniref:RNA helicase-related protein required for pre-mRNA splicing n=1 Tax=Scheffersomyces coipomensis TaxID=1788519 RepID=UPI00315DC40C